MSHKNSMSMWSIHVTRQEEAIINNITAPRIIHKVNNKWVLSKNPALFRDVRQFVTYVKTVKKLGTYLSRFVARTCLKRELPKLGRRLCKWTGSELDSQNALCYKNVLFIHISDVRQILQQNWWSIWVGIKKYYYILKPKGNLFDLQQFDWSIQWPHSLDSRCCWSVVFRRCSRS